MSEPRIYAIVARTVKPVSRTVIQSDGRMAAQACHAEALFRHKSPEFPKDQAFRNIATIVLEARDEKELAHIEALCLNHDVAYASYSDENPEVYGTPNRVWTAIAVYGEPENLGWILGYIPLFPYKI